VSREAFERTVARVMTEPVMQESGITEERARDMVRPVAEQADREPPPKPMSKAEHQKAVDALPEPTVRRTRHKIDGDSRLHWELDQEAGTAPPRVSLHGEADRKAAGDMHRRREAKVISMLERTK